jgi:hypothetical protein
MPLTLLLAGGEDGVVSLGEDGVVSLGEDGVVSLGEDGVVSLWTQHKDGLRGQRRLHLQRSLCTHTQAVICLAVSQPYSLIVSGQLHISPCGAVLLVEKPTNPSACTLLKPHFLELAVCSRTSCYFFLSIWIDIV